MIRSTCAWLLLLLAASPVTAPFSTCDLRVFLTHAAGVQPDAHAHFGTLSAAKSEQGEADSLSTLVSRTAQSQGSPFSLSALRVRIPRVSAAARVTLPLGVNRSPHELPHSATVLRL